MTHHPNEGEAEGQRMDAPCVNPNADLEDMQINLLHPPTPSAEIEALTEHVSRWIGAVACDGVLCGPAQQDCRDTITQAMQANASVLTDARAELATAIEERDAMRAELVALRQDANDAAVALAEVTANRNTIVDAAARLLRSIQEATPRANQSGHGWSWDGSWILTKDGERHGMELIAAIDATRKASPALPDEWTTMDGPPNGTPDTTEKT